MSRDANLAGTNQSLTCVLHVVTTKDLADFLREENIDPNNEGVFLAKGVAKDILIRLKQYLGLPNALRYGKVILEVEWRKKSGFNKTFINIETMLKQEYSTLPCITRT